MGCNYRDVVTGVNNFSTEPVSAYKHHSLKNVVPN